ncbi:methylase of polypeptide subunit release factors [Kribbella sp. VKM Ac-2571]|uniref:methyltransferase n=1 Tax=Kribbella sp. VKM Ac-2571 TaxID=2512222 RepID=UPI00106058F7|nr:class I SAM-dependent methyltransferase [Kribbella sp. VKM Ac-2571]TDO68332.1 methylase of polypeptide subunit release factors [Kribbella sp. VKM Ac-2571]
MDHVTTIDDSISADRALRLIRRGSTLHWEGDFQNAKQLLAALGRRLPAPRGGTFHDRRRHQAERVRVLNSLLVPLIDHRITLRRAPDVRTACRETYGAPDGERWVPLRELLGVIGAHQLRLRGVYVPALGERIHPHYSVFAPTRSEYADLVAECPLPAGKTAFDVGTGTGLLAAILSRRGIRQVVATDNNPRAVACARENLERLRVNATIVETDLFPPGRADLIVCNPPWIPAAPATVLDQAVYDEDGRMLRAFLGTVREHLAPGGEVWLILSDLAERLGLRERGELSRMIRSDGLRVAGRADAVPRHRRARDGETTSLWRLRSSAFVSTIGG